MSQADSAPLTHTRRRLWLLLIAVLLLLRVPSLAQPPGADQGLYHYVATRIAAGDVPYRDVWEQKPPGIFYAYAALRTILPADRLVPAADLAAAGLTAWVLILLGRRLGGVHTGELAATLFLLLGDPGIQRLAGLHLRAQCETFIALAVALALWIACRTPSSLRAAAWAGLALGAAVWLKYNAVAYALPVIVAIATAGGRRSGDTLRGLVVCGGALIATLLAGVAGFAAAGALPDLRLATVDYNLAYSGETYNGALDVLRYVAIMPISRAAVDGLWFFGGIGTVLILMGDARHRPEGRIALAWLAASVLSIAMNGARGLPQYFLQAGPALAFAASIGLMDMWNDRGRPGRAAWLVPATVMLAVAGFWRVGADPVPKWQPRAFGLPQALNNAIWDGRALSGSITHDDYLNRFERADGGKISPASIERLAAHMREHVPAGTPVYVFGFATGEVYVRADRRSASRFFWSRPVVIGFEASRPGYGSTGLLAELESAAPGIVALQKHDWGLAETLPDSIEFFMNTPELRGWLEQHYAFDYEDQAYAVWRRKT